jgi:hypothetical protein
VDISIWRDIILIIWGVVATLAIIFIAVLLFLFYRKTINLIESTDVVVGRVSGIVDYLDEEIIRPVSRFGTMIQGIMQGIGMFSSIFKKKGDQDE